MIFKILVYCPGSDAVKLLIFFVPGNFGVITIVSPFEAIYLVLAERLRTAFLKERLNNFTDNCSWWEYSREILVGGSSQLVYSLQLQIGVRQAK